jgi:hypothetical protein
VSTAASIALIFLIIEALIACLVPLALLSGMVFYVMPRLRRVLTQQVLPQGQAITARVYVTTRDVSDKIAKPFVAVHKISDQVRVSAQAAGRRVREQARSISRSVNT